MPSKAAAASRTRFRHLRNSAVFSVPNSLLSVTDSVDRAVQIRCSATSQIRSYVIERNHFLWPKARLHRRASAKFVVFDTACHGVRGSERLTFCAQRLSCRATLLFEEASVVTCNEERKSDGI